MSKMGYTREQLAALAEASSERLRFPERIRRVLTVAGEDYSGNVGSPVYGRQEGIAVVLEAELDVPLPSTYEQEEVRVDWVVLPSGTTLPGFKGRAVEVNTEGSRTTLVAATGGYEAARTPVGEEGEDREYAGTAPSAVVYDLLSALRGFYDGFEIPRKNRPAVHLRDSERVYWTQHIADPLKTVEGLSGLVPADVPRNVAGAYVAGPVEQAGAHAWVFEEGLDTEPGGVSVETAESERYARVVVWAPNGATGDHDALTEPIKVDNRGRRVNPRSTFFVEMTEELAADGSTPYEVGMREALRLGRNDARVTVNPRYPPFFLARGDVVLAVKRTSVAGGTLVSTYRVLLDAVPVEGMGGSPAGEAELVSEMLEEADLLPDFPRAPSFSRPLWGLMPNGSDPFVDDGLPWAREDPGGLHVVLDVEAAAAHGVEIFTDPTDPEAVVIRYP